jgi:hypothetical protein
MGESILKQKRSERIEFTKDQLKEKKIIIIMMMMMVMDIETG